MRLIWAASLAIAWLGSSACADVAHEPAPSLARAAILRGHPVREGEAWGTVALVVSEHAEPGEDVVEWLCSGTLIAPQLVVTAAHCIKDEFTSELAASVLVIAGADDVSSASQDQLYEATRFVAHARALTGEISGDPSGLGADYDIAIVETRRPVTQVSPVPVLEAERLDEVLAEGTELIIAGYGTRVIDEDTGLSDLDGLHYVGSQHYQRRSEHEFLAGSSRDADTCPGDSGGPAYVMLDGEAWLVGATSRGRDDFPDVECGEGGIYTLIPSFASWIDEQAAAPLAGEDDAGAVDVDDDLESSDGGTSEHAGRRRGREGGCSLAQGTSRARHSLFALLALVALVAYRRARAGQRRSS